MITLKLGRHQITISTQPRLYTCELVEHQIDSTGEVLPDIVYCVLFENVCFQEAKKRLETAYSDFGTDEIFRLIARNETAEIVSIFEWQNSSLDNALDSLIGIARY